ncbi:protein TIFY 10c isoform X1 [Lolium perenne]|uniref:protein TIFY 10c isoform X1 n=1 Tax=Lolium perenne TaxID=4522 RepID=UPI0021EAAEFF|nr:protein TIFY 10c-like isoform X1 [Lolium perenne]
MTYAEGEGSGKTTMAAAKENSKSSFAVTCGLLSRYLRENKGGALQGLAGLGMAPPATAIEGGAFQPPTTMNLLSGLEDPKPDTVDVQLAVGKGQLLQAPTGNQDAHQLTIFYGGKVVVVDNFPSTEVKALLQMANAAGDGAVDRAGSGSGAVPQSLPGPADNNLPDLPIARRNSLHRFLEKRKGRITAKAPYQANSASSAPSKQANGDKFWLGLGQEVAIKQEI